MIHFSMSKLQRKIINFLLQFMESQHLMEVYNFSWILKRGTHT